MSIDLEPIFENVEQKNIPDMERTATFPCPDRIYSIIFFKYMITAFSAVVVSLDILVSEISNSKQPQCPLKVGKQIIRRNLSISGL